MHVVDEVLGMIVQISSKMMLTKAITKQSMWVGLISHPH